MSWIQSHGADALLLYFLFSAIVSGMPEPEAGASLGYQWAYHSLHTLAGDLSAIVSKLPAFSKSSEPAEPKEK